MNAAAKRIGPPADERRIIDQCGIRYTDGMDSARTVSGASGGPVGVFDSGVGGLSVLRAIREELPAEALLYVADSAYAPYGDRPDEYIERRSSSIVQFLIQRRAKAIVVACNTATGVSIGTL